VEELLALIKEKQATFAKAPFFEYLRDTKINPNDRMAFAPCLTFFVMSFGELNRYVLRSEPTTDPIQELVNQHSYEDEDHWIWFLEDLTKLGYDESIKFTESIRFLWSDETRVQRDVVRWMFQEAESASALHRVVLVEALESTADAFLAITQTIAHELKISDGRDCRYFGDMHTIVDTNHTMHTNKNSQNFLHSLQFTPEERQEALRIIDKTFDMFVMLISDLLAHIKVPKTINGNFMYSYELRSCLVRKVKPLGTYLIEAGLLTYDKLNMALKEQQVTSQHLGDIISSHGWVQSETIEYLMEKIVKPEREAALAHPSENTPSLDNEPILIGR
jgi:hypothetical protein